MRKPISLTIMGLTLLAVASTKDQTLFVYLIGFLVALALYFIAVTVLFALAASPVIIAGSLWLYKRHRHGKPLPAWLKSLRRRATRRFSPAASHHSKRSCCEAGMAAERQQ